MGRGVDLSLHKWAASYALQWVYLETLTAIELYLILTSYDFHFLFVPNLNLILKKGQPVNREKQLTNKERDKKKTEIMTKNRQKENE